MIDAQTPAGSHGAPASDLRTRAAGWPLVLGERGLLAGLVALVLLLASVPTLAGYLGSPADRRFQGIVYGVADTTQYFSWMRDHRTEWLVPNRMTAEANEPALFNLLWLVLGRVQVATGLPTPVLFHGVRLLAGAALLLMLYTTCARFTQGRSERLTAFLVTALGAGLGWVWVVVKYAQGLADVPFPFDVYVAEPNTLFILMAFPHFTIATTLILGVFLCYLAALRTRNRWLVAAAALLALTLTLQHAYDLLIVTLVPGGALALMLLRDRRLPWFAGLSVFVIGLVALPPPLYFTWLTSGSPLWREVLDQFSNAGVFTPPPHHLLILMGLPLLLVLGAIISAVARRQALAQIGRAIGKASDEDLLLWSWLVVGFGLLYIPTDFQIHMLIAWQIPVGLLAVRWLHRTVMPALARSRPRFVQALPALLLVAVLPTSLYLLSWRVFDLGRHQAPYSIGAGDERVLSWLGGATTRDDIVLSALTLGQFVPVYSDGRTFIGHWAQTAHFYEKQAAVAAFYDAATPEGVRQQLIAEHGITFVIHGSEERALGSFDPSRSPLLVQAFAAGETAVYRVR